MNLFSITLFVLTVIMITGCNDNEVDENVELYSDKEEAINHYLSEEGVEGSVEFVETGIGDSLLLIENPQDTFYIAEVLSIEDSFGVVDLSSRAQIGGTPGAAWGFTTDEDNDYTVIVRDEESPSFNALSGEEYYFTILEGHDSVSATDSAVPEELIMIENTESVQ